MSEAFEEVFTESGPHRGAWLCYINGLEVPIVGWQVDYGVWQIPTATIHLFPERCVERIGAEDRVQVALFYLDHWAGPHAEFRLMFDGEVIGWSYQHSHGQRTIALSCQAHIQIFQQLFFFYMTTMDDVVAAGTQESLSQNLQTAGFFYPYELFHQGLIKSVDEPNKMIERPFDLVYNVIAGLISTLVPTANRSSPMLNFFSRWVRRTRFYNRWVSLPVFEREDRIARRAGLFPIFRAVRNVEALNAMQRRAADTSNRGPVWDLLQDMLGMVYMEIQMLPTAPCVKADHLTRQILGPLRTNDPLVDQTQIARDYHVPAGATPTTAPPTPAPGTPTPTVEAATSEPSEAMSFLNRELARLRSNRLVTAVANALDEGDTATRRASEARIAQTTESLRRSAMSVENWLRQTTQHLLDTGPEDIAEQFEALRTVAEREHAERDATAASREAAATTPTPVEPPATTYGAARSGTPPTQPVTLAQYTVKPQMFFGVAPSCNVLYPSMVESWTYDESYTQQPTRLYVNDSLFSNLMNGRTANTSASTFASIALTVGYPEEADAVLNSVRAQTPSTGEHRPSGKNVLIWAEEFFKGPVTARATLPQWFQMLTQLRNGKSDKSPTNAPDAPGVLNRRAEPRVRAQEYAQRTTNRWNNFIGEAVRDISRRPDLFPNTPPEFFVGITASLGRGDYGERSRTGVSQAMGLFDLEVTHNPRAPYNRLGDVWMRLRDHAQVRSILGRVATDKYEEAFSDSGIRDEVAVSLVHWRRDYGRIIQNQVSGTGIQVVEGTLLYAALLQTSHGAGGVIRDLLESVPAVKQAAIAANGTPHQWRDILRAYASGGNDGTIQATRPGGRYRNRFHVLLRALQEIEIGRRLASNPGAAGLSSPNAAAFFNPGFSTPAEETAVYETITRLGFAPYRSQRVPLDADGRPVTATPAAAPTPEDGEFDTTEPPPSEESEAHEAGPAPAQPHATPSAPPRPVTNSSTGTTVGDSTREGIVGAEEYQRLFRVYAQYEFMRQRYDKRRGGAQLAFNPYVVPGYPMHLFDRMTTEHHIVGYIMTVSQSGFVSSGSQANLATQVTYSFGRTVGEFLADVRRDALRFNEAVASAPAEVIDEIRTVIQDANEADTFYNQLLYAGSRPNKAAFRFVTRHGLPALYNTTNSRGRRVAIEVSGANSPNENMRLVEQAEDDSAEATATTERVAAADAARRASTPRESEPVAGVIGVIPAQNASEVEVIMGADGLSAEDRARPAPRNISVEPPNASMPNPEEETRVAQAEADRVAAARRQVNADSAALSRSRAAQPTFDGTRRIIPSASEMACFENYDTAMKRVARPICTLAEYIRFWHGGQPIRALENARIIERGEDDYSFATVSDSTYTGNNIAGVSSAARNRQTTTRGTASYWKRIYTFRQGSANMPVPDASVLRATQVAHEYRWDVATGDVGTLPGNFPETRDNWDKWLVKYRDTIRYKLSPQR